MAARLDRLARSLSHLPEVIEGLEAEGVRFKSLRDPVDTPSPQENFPLQVLGAAAELECHVVERARRREPDDRLMAIVAAIAGSAPDTALQQIADRLEALRAPTPRGWAQWSVSSVKMRLDRAKTRDLITAELPE